MLEVSFNSPQCGWMSIGFNDGENEFRTTTAHAPHERALPELMRILAAMANGEDGEHLLKWNRDPEEYDFRFIRSGENIAIEIYQYPTEERDSATREFVYSYSGDAGAVIAAFATTFDQLYEDRQTDEFEFNWRQPFPLKEYEEFKRTLGRK
jgi:hypothetical protein